MIRARWYGEMSRAVALCYFAGGGLFACGWLGDTDSVNRASELAISCETQAALDALAAASEAGGLGRYLADLERIAILRDAGRKQEASVALNAYLALPENEGTERRDIDESIARQVEALRSERQKRTGSATCPSA